MPAECHRLGADLIETRARPGERADVRRPNVGAAESDVSPAEVVRDDVESVRLEPAVSAVRAPLAAGRVTAGTHRPQNHDRLQGGRRQKNGPWTRERSHPGDEVRRLANRGVVHGQTMGRSAPISRTTTAPEFRHSAGRANGRQPGSALPTELHACGILVLATGDIPYGASRDTEPGPGSDRWRELSCGDPERSILRIA
jgi:hypothetical protein